MTGFKADGHINLLINRFPGNLENSKNSTSEFEDNYALIWMKSGKGKYQIDFKNYELGANRIILISKAQNVNFTSLENAEYETLTITEDFVSNSNEQVQQLLSFCIREHFEGKQILELSNKDSSYLQGIANQIERVLKEWSGPIKSNSLYHLGQLFLLYCHQLSLDQQTEPANLFNPVISNFTSVLEGNFNKTQKVSFYIDQLHITYNALARHTSNYCGKTPKEIIVERIILEIKRLLASTKMSIKEIAYSLGFDEPTNMVKYFKKYTGITPTIFRKSF